ncbi:DUF1778 domain-containing protein [Adlercreutzia sp. ZJ242]|uniref:type II toxin-antitoxin system TacA family antitoxin n=1 Tax=Adlercreutzia sp. ZJ242 TaxID=2709409 RepID=UPI0013EACDE0|nr:DUF1778 domain-containing protein [Adlercreutzia sp. ZJ242]
MAPVMERSCRIDIRLTQPQRTSYERAAALKGQTLSQWTTQHLDECARRDIDEARATQLDDEAFEVFCQMLEAPLPKAASELLAREEIWV